MTNYVKLSDYLRYIPRPLLKESSTTDFLVWMLEAVRKLPTIVHTYPKIQIFEFDSYKLELDPEIRQINLVTYLANIPDDNDCESLTSCVENPEVMESDTTTNDICRYTINYKLFLDSVYFKRNYMPLKYVGVGGSDLLCEKCPNRFLSNCAETFVIDKDRVLHTNLESGFLCIDYDTEVDGNNCMIPDYDSIKDFLVKYAILKHWEERSFSKEESSRQYWQQYLPMVDIAFKKARGEVFMKQYDVNLAKDIIFSTLRNLNQLPGEYVYSR